MSSLALMRWLETAPDRYDAGMHAITLGRAERVQAAAAALAAPEPGRRVLELGCGTGAVTARLAERGARLTALDQSPEMLERAKTRLGPRAGEVEWLESTASEIDALPVAGFDAVVASFALSEMSSSERRFVLVEAARRLAPGGLVVIADEVWPARRGARGLFRLLRWPQAAAGWLLAGVVSHPLEDPSAELRAAGLTVVRTQSWLLGSLCLLAAEPEATG